MDIGLYLRHDPDLAYSALPDAPVVVEPEPRHRMRGGLAAALRGIATTSGGLADRIEPRRVEPSRTGTRITRTRRSGWSAA